MHPCHFNIVEAIPDIDKIALVFLLDIFKNLFLRDPVVVFRAIIVRVETVQILRLPMRLHIGMSAVAQEQNAIPLFF